MKKILALVLCLCMVMSMSAVAMADYTDIDGHWAEGSIDRWTAYGIVEGFEDEFDPSGTMTRGQAAAVFARLLKLTEKADISKYTDVDGDAWYADYIAMCVAAGILNGVGDDAMDPKGTLTREQMMTMLCRALGIQPEDTCDKEFDDADKVSGWAEGYLNALVNKGIVSGMTEDTLAPELDINRASVMTLLDKAIVVYVAEDNATVTVPEGTGVILVVGDNAVIEDAPEGTIVITGTESTGTTVNGTEVKEDTVIVVEKEEEQKPSGGSTGGGVVTPPADPNPTEPTAPTDPNPTDPTDPVVTDPTDPVVTDPTDPVNNLDDPA